ncbi:putative FAD-binding domain, FAD/NAD(P)-binding domain superfamily [Septoria linicola]|nr:putative FAD-binding domain, FAD/NAD(P)-binding domain superfamily [Septoria linicola]
MPRSILILGSGIAGPPLASFLLLSPLPVHELPHITILERRTKSDLDKGQNIDVRGTGEEGCQFVDDKSRTWASFAADKTGKIQTGTSDIEILRGRLGKILAERFQALSEDVKKEGGKGIDFLFGDYVQELTEIAGGVAVKFAKSGKTRKFDIVIGADGLQSRTRRMVWGESGGDERLFRIGMYGGFFSMPRGATDSEWRRWFHTSGRRGIMVRPSDELDTTTVFMHVMNHHDPRLEEVARDGRRGEQAQTALLAEYVQNAGWECSRVVKEMEASNDFYYDMVAQVKMPKWAKSRVALLGEAGYCASPISGMGTTLALNGAYSLAGALVRHPDDHLAAFEEYEATMRPLVDRAQKLPLGGKAPYILNPETGRCVQVLHVVLGFICWSGVANLIARFAGPPANAVPVRECGFRQASEWTE